MCTLRLDGSSGEGYTEISVHPAGSSPACTFAPTAVTLRCDRPRLATSRLESHGESRSASHPVSHGRSGLGCPHNHQSPKLVLGPMQSGRPVLRHYGTHPSVKHNGSGGTLGQGCQHAQPIKSHLRLFVCLWGRITQRESFAGSSSSSSSSSSFCCCCCCCCCSLFGGGSLSQEYAMLEAFTKTRRPRTRTGNPHARAQPPFYLMTFT